MSRTTFFLVFSFLALIDFFVPFYLLGDVASFYASYLFWCLLTLSVIVAGSLYVKMTWGG
ncbi:MAG: hypothetical protein ACOC6I_01100 [Candidatus Bipolaricaulota bacterium]